VVNGPLDPTAQHWTYFRPEHLPKRSGVPSAEHFVPVTRETVRDPKVKPWEVGLFTSTGAWGGHSMWRVYQAVCSSMYPARLPTWRLEVDPDAAVSEIRCAEDWVRFVERYPAVAGHRVYPNWPAVAKDWDGIHFTAFAIAATQGLVFPMGKLQIQPLMLDVEQTFWLSWRFGGAVALEGLPARIE
jgi:hypothetical protein